MPPKSRSPAVAPAHQGADEVIAEKAALVHQQDMKHHMTPLDCVAFILIKGDQVLAEKRKLTKQIDPGAIALPGGQNRLSALR